MRALRTAIGLVVAVSASAAMAQYPAKPVKIIMPYAAGGGNDIITRIVAQKLTENTGKVFIVENRTGAGGRVGYELAAKSPADGYTLVGTETGYNMLPALYGAKLSWDAESDLVPVTQLANWSFVVVVSPKLNVKSFPELIEIARANPGKFNYGSAGNATINHAGGELLKREAKIDITHVPYKGMGEAVGGMLNGSIEIMLIGPAPVLTHINSGKMVPLAAASAHRSPVLPAVPSAAEIGYPRLLVGNWAGLSAPKGTPKAAIDWIRDEVVKVLAMPDVKERFASLGVEPSGMTPDQYGALMRSDADRWTEVIRAAGITAQ